MSKSTELMTATYVAAFVGARAPLAVNTELIAKMVRVHPSRTRKIVSKLVKADILKSIRGGNGGISLARSADEITLAEIYDAIQENSILNLGLHNPFSDWGDHCFVHKVFEEIHSNLEGKMRADLSNILLIDMFVPWAPPEHKSKEK